MVKDILQAEVIPAFSSLFQSGSHSDVLVRSAKRSYRAHKALLCSRSAFFQATFSSNFREGHTNEIDLSDDDALAVDCMMHYFYYFDYAISDQEHHGLCARTRPDPVSQWRMPRKRSKLGDVPWSADPLLVQAAAAQSGMTSQRRSAPPESRNDKPASTRGGNSAKDDMDQAERANLRLDGCATMLDRDAPPRANASQIKTCLLAHASVYALAEQYGVPGLKAAAKRKFEVAAVANPEVVMQNMAEIVEAIDRSVVEEDRGLHSVVLYVARLLPESTIRCNQTAFAHLEPGRPHDAGSSQGLQKC